MNDKEDLNKMVCTENDTSINITIPVVMIPKSARDVIQQSWDAGQKVEILLYAPNRPAVDFSEIFLWMMAVGTIVCATLWFEFIACEQTDERYNEITKRVSLSCLIFNGWPWTTRSPVPRSMHIRSDGCIGLAAERATSFVELWDILFNWSYTRSLSACQLK